MAEKHPDINRERDAARKPEGTGHSPLDRTDALSAIQMGHVYLESDSYSDAIECFERAADDALRTLLDIPGLSSLLSGMARCHIGLG